MDYTPTEQEVEALVAEMIPLLDQETDAKWQQGDLLVSRILGSMSTDGHALKANNGALKWYEALQRGLAEQGRVVSISTLRSRYITSQKFPVAERYDGVPWSTHLVFAEAQGDARQRMAEFMGSDHAPSRRNAEDWLGVNQARDYSTPAVKKFIAENPKVVAEVLSDSDFAKEVVTQMTDEATATVVKHIVHEDNTPRPAPRPTPTEPEWSISAAMSTLQVAIEMLIRESLHNQPSGFGLSGSGHAADLTRDIDTLTAFRDWMADPSHPFRDPHAEHFDIAEGPLYVSDIVGPTR